MGIYSSHIQKFKSALPDITCSTAMIDRVAYSTDASLYKLLPSAIVRAFSIDDVQRILAVSNDIGLPVTLRSAGSSLSGQAIGEGIIVLLSGREFEQVEIKNEGEQICVGASVRGAMANAQLRRYKKKIGPDPASINTCFIAGIVANNASGMCCGTEHNSYNTVSSLEFVVAEGTYYSTSDKASRQRFHKEQYILSDGIASLRDAIRLDAELCKKIRHKYKIKNTVGYSLNSFLDFDDPIDIFSHLLIGSEGTLAAICSATFSTIPLKDYTKTCFILVDSLDVACEIIDECATMGAAAIEMMDAKALRSVQQPTLAFALHDVHSEGCGLLVEFQCDTESEARQCEITLRRYVESGIKIRSSYFTTTDTERDILWGIRKGILPSIGGARAPGTTFINEDIAFPRNVLSDAIKDLQQLFLRYEYHDAVIYGHAKDGNLHFALSQKFDSTIEVERYADFMQSLSELVVQRYNGSLKAEHGTGRNVAPFVEMEWGRDAVEVMRKVKQLADPKGILNPGVLLNLDQTIHLKNLKSIPILNNESDRCIECGFCEHVCPSHGLTLSPRQRIVVQRELHSTHDVELHTELKTDWNYFVVDTCAVDGMCAMQCPVGINTGSLVKELRHSANTPLSSSIAQIAAKNIQSVRSVVSAGSSVTSIVASLVGESPVQRISELTSELLGTPIWSPLLPQPAEIKYNSSPDADVTFLPSCTTHLMGASSDGRTIQELFYELCNRAGIIVQTPKECSSVCCGNVFSSKGYHQAYSQCSSSFASALASITQNNPKSKHTIVIDSPSCYYEYVNSGSERATVMELCQYLSQVLLPRLEIKQRRKSVVLHHTCAAVKSNSTEWMNTIARACAENVIIPMNSGCCGFAGDRGLLYPELPTHATSRVTEELSHGAEVDGYYSNNPPCQTSLSMSTGKSYKHIIELLYSVTNIEHHQ